ncbi:hypothetical protein JQ615_41250 [Bradyrhizobium jicamae]|uniref:Uncharacterized protein n=1 Tax=Bradyrhizobium jicamae TaxID=280332 RepID=A0ABS5FY57_9BRAD|nr:hypothetical protein [Bradyrhizobium jicamae]MBR0801769.1 hypothetical protein [Bradyrhizobium jicamae]
MADTIAGNFSIGEFVSFTYFEEGDPPNAAVFVFKDIAGKTLVLTTALTVASEMRALLGKAFSQMEDADHAIATQTSSERIEYYSAAPSPDNPDEVVIVIEGERSDPIHGRMKKADARSLATLLSSAADRGQKPN